MMNEPIKYKEKGRRKKHNTHPPTHPHTHTHTNNLTHIHLDIPELTYTCMRAFAKTFSSSYTIDQWHLLNNA